MKIEMSLAAALAASLWAAHALAELQRTVLPLAGKAPAAASQAMGTFEVKVKPLLEDVKVPGVKVGRMSISKEWKGSIEGVSKGEMMTTETPVKGSAGYVAVEYVAATLNGRRGTFTLLHHATMKSGGDMKMTIVVVPDSGTGQLVGLAGTLTIIIQGGKHSYRFDYTLPAPRSSERR